MNKLKVLSLFDGISCGQVALERAQIPVDVYYASEINKYAIQITQKNYPKTIQLGDVNNWKEWDIDWSSIDLLIGGSPCQGFSFAGKQLNFKDSRSKLFFVYAEILEHIQQLNPNVKFLLENVNMKKQYQEIINKYLKVTPIEINSALVSAQNRKRLYWTNIKGIKQPSDKHIMLQDIYIEQHNDLGSIYIPEATKKGYTKIKVNEGVDLTFITSKTRRGRRMEDKCNCLTATNYDYRVLIAVNKYEVHK